MVICRKPLILLIDLVSGLLVAGIAAAAIGLIVVPHLEDSERLPGLHRRITDAHLLKDKLVAHNAETLAAVEALDQRLREQSATAPTDVSAFLEELAKLCSRTSVTLEQFQPLPVVRGAAFDSLEVRIAARGRFPDFHRVLSGIESQSPYVLIRDVTVTAPEPTQPDECRLSWTVRVNYRPAHDGLSGDSGGRP
jgi:Tfp pilus assembly protein PilO